MFLVFFLDYKVPFVPSEKEYELVFIREGERVVIPCRGSVENLNVTLYTVRKSCFFLLVCLCYYLFIGNKKTDT